MYRFSMVPWVVIGLLMLLVECNQVSGQQNTNYEVAITNKSGTDVQYLYRNGENTNTVRPWTLVTIKNGATVKLPYVASADYGIDLKENVRGNKSGPNIAQSFGPYEIRENGPFYNAKGQQAFPYEHGD